MRKLLYIAAALATFDAAFLCGSDAQAASGYWNKSGFSVSHEFYPGRHSSYFNYAPSNINSYYFIGSRPSRYGRSTEASDRPADTGPAHDQPIPIEWAKKCRSSCLDLSGDR